MPFSSSELNTWTGLLIFTIGSVAATTQSFSLQCSYANINIYTNTPWSTPKMAPYKTICKKKKKPWTTTLSPQNLQLYQTYQNSYTLQSAHLRHHHADFENSCAIYTKLKTDEIGHTFERATPNAHQQPATTPPPPPRIPMSFTVPHLNA